MSLIQAVLESAETVAITTLRKEVPDISIKSENLKRRILEYLTKIYIDVETKVSMKTVKDHLQQANQLTTRYQSLQTSLNDLINCTDLHLQMKIISDCLTMCRNVCLIQLNIQFDDCNIDQASIENVLKLVNYWKEIGDKSNPMPYLLSDVLCMKTQMKIKLQDIIQDVLTVKNETIDSIETYTITIKKSDEDLQNTFKLIAKYDEDFRILDDTTEYYRTSIFNIFELIVKYSTNMTIKDLDCMVYKLEVDRRHKDGYAECFSQLVKFNEFLNGCFNYDLVDGVTLLMRIGEDVREDLNKILIESLQDVLIGSVKDEEKYKQIIDCIVLLQKNLTQNNIFTPETTTLLDYANKKHLPLINKQCHDYRQLGINIMKKDINNITTVGTNIDSPKYNNSMFAQCMVSSSVLELLQLIEKIMTLAVGSSEIYAKHLYATAKNILFQYPIIIKELYGSHLSNSAQHVAIFYNNCLYISHDISCGKWYEIDNKLSSAANISIAQFDYIQKHMHKFANEILQNFITNQIDSLLNLIKLNDLEKQLWNCMEQLRSLKTIWQPILNSNIFKTIMGLLLDSICKSLCDTIFKLENMNLIEVCRIVQKSGPELFVNVSDIDCVQHWRKMSELVGMLDAVPENVEDRWCDGKGLLAEHFSFEEMQKIIDFLNTNC